LCRESGSSIRRATVPGNLFDPLFGELAVEPAADIPGMPVLEVAHG
jgi:hypothetical protein